MAYFYLDTSYSQVKLKVNYTITQNKPKNQSTVKVDLYFVNTARVSSWNETGQAYYNIGINNQRKGDTYFKFDLRNKSPQTQTYIGSHTRTVTHDSTGEATIPIWIYLRSGISIGTVNQSRHISLPRIVNQSNITSLSSANIDDGEIVVTIDNTQSGYRYALDVKVDGQTHWTRTPTTTRVSLPITQSIRERILRQVTYASTATISATLETYDSSGNRLGSPSRETSTLTIGTSYAPYTGQSTLTQVNQKNGKLFEGISSVRFDIGQSTSGAINVPKAQYGASLTDIRLVNLLNGRVLKNLSPSEVQRLTNGQPVELNADNLPADDYKFRLEMKDSRGLISYATWANIYTVHSYQLPKILEFSTERDGNNLTVKAEIEPGSDAIEYLIYIKKSGTQSYERVFSSKKDLPLKAGTGVVNETFSSYLSSWGSTISVNPDDSFDVELRLYYTSTDYVSARGTIGTADVPLSLGKFGAGVGKVVDDRGAHLQVGSRGIDSDGPIMHKGEDILTTKTNGAVHQHHIGDLLLTYGSFNESSNNQTGSQFGSYVRFYDPYKSVEDMSVTASLKNTGGKHVIQAYALGDAMVWYEIYTIDGSPIGNRTFEVHIQVIGKGA